jgi:hypothetical protein
MRRGLGSILVQTSIADPSVAELALHHSEDVLHSAWNPEHPAFAPLLATTEMTPGRTFQCLGPVNVRLARDSFEILAHVGLIAKDGAIVFAQ